MAVFQLNQEELRNIQLLIEQQDRMLGKLALYVENTKTQKIQQYFEKEIAYVEMVKAQLMNYLN